jgi:gliding motility-associated lipoprotein GldH
MTLFSQIKSAFLFLLISLFLYSCDSRQVYNDYRKLKKDTWNRYNLQKFDIAVKDTVSLYDFYINIRNTTDYPYSNIYLFFNTKFPDGRKFRDTLELQLADLQGKWLGRGPGKIKDNHFRFKNMVRFPLKGIYSFTIEQAMRVEDLTGITDIGLQVEIH